MCRKAQHKDCGAVYRLICTLEGEQLPYEYFRSVFEKQISSKQYCCLVYEVQGNVAGLVNLRYEEQLHHPRPIAEILEFIVAPQHRSQKIGQKLFAEACHQARKMNCVQIEAACNQARTNAHRFYEMAGMEYTHFKFSMELG